VSSGDPKGGCFDSCGEMAAGCLLLILLAAAGLYYWFVQTQKSVKEQEARSREQLAARRAMIPLTDIAPSDLRLSAGSFPELTGRIANNSRFHSVSMVDFVVTVYDCPSARAALPRCTIVASDTATALEDIPPGQARDFRSFVTLPYALQVRGRMRWTYGIVSVTAAAP